MKLAIFVFMLSTVGLSQEITITQPANIDVVRVSFHYALPDSDEFVKASKVVPTMAPTTILWMWGDTDKSYEYFPYAKGQDVKHTYKAGEYTVVVSVIDAKNRLIRQTRMRFKVVAYPVTAEP